MPAPKPALNPGAAPRAAKAAPETLPETLDDMPEECPLCAAHGGPNRTPNAETLAAMRDAHEGRNLSYYSSFDEMMRDIDQTSE